MTSSLIGVKSSDTVRISLLHIHEKYARMLHILSMNTLQVIFLFGYQTLRNTVSKPDFTLQGFQMHHQ